MCAPRGVVGVTRYIDQKNVQSVDFACQSVDHGPQLHPMEVTVVSSFIVVKLREGKSPEAGILSYVQLLYPPKG